MCPTEIVAFSNAVDDFAAINTKVVAVSTDSKFTHLQWVRTPRDQGGLGPVKLPLIADVSKDISRAYGMLVEDPEDELYGAALRYEARARVREREPRERRPGPGGHRAASPARCRGTDTEGGGARGPPAACSLSTLKEQFAP